LALLLIDFLKSTVAQNLIRINGLRGCCEDDFTGEIYQALLRQLRQRPDKIESPAIWVAVNARWHLKNSLRRERKQLLTQPVSILT
jgi:hypothetical protein